MEWEVQLPYARTLGTALPLAFGALTVLTIALPARVSAGAILAPAALLLWCIWLLWAYPSARFRNGEFLIRNPLRTARFTASPEVIVTGTGVPRFTVGNRHVRPVVMLISPGGVIDTAHARMGIVSGVNVVSMSSLAPGNDAERVGPATVLQAVCARAGNRSADFRQEWNLAGIAITVALAAWTLTTIW